MSESWLPIQRKVASEPPLRRLTISSQREPGQNGVSPVRRIRRKDCSDLPPQPRRSSEEA